jgi:hypothetical protein
LLVSGRESQDWIYTFVSTKEQQTSNIKENVESLPKIFFLVLEPRDSFDKESWCNLEDLSIEKNIDFLSRHLAMGTIKLGVLEEVSDEPEEN